MCVIGNISYLLPCLIVYLKVLEKFRLHSHSISLMVVLSLRDSYLETMSLFLFFKFGDTEPLSSLDRGIANHVCPCLCLPTAAIRFFTLSPSVEASCAMTLASSKSVPPSPMCGKN